MEPPTTHKRKRTSHACETCRQRKSRCDGARPVCDICASLNLECRYREPAKSSWRDDPVPRLEYRLEMMEQLLQTVLAGNVQTGHAPMPGNPTGETAHRATSSQTTEKVAHVASTGQERHPIASPATANDGVDGMGLIAFAGEGFSGLLGPTSTSSFFKTIFRVLKVVRTNSLLTPETTNTTGDSTPGMISRPVSPPVHEKPHQSGTKLLNMADTFELPPSQESFALVDSFFANTGKLFPYLHRPTIVEILTDMYRPGDTCTNLEHLCQINMIMAFASIYSPSGCAAKEKLEQGDLFFQRAVALVPDIRIKAATIESVQAMLMVSQYAEGNQGSVQTWGFLGSAIQAAFELGLYTSSRSQRFSLIEKEIRKRTWWMCFIMDKMCSMTFGRPPMIPNTYMSVELPLDLELEAVSDKDPTRIAATVPSTPSSPSIFIFTSSLNMILGEIIEKVYQQNIEAREALPLPRLFEQVIKIEGDLRQWRHDLPPSLSVVTSSDLLTSPTGQKMPVDRFRIILSLRYLNTHALLHRTILSRFLEIPHSKSSSMVDFLCNIGGSSINIGLVSAIDTIKIISHSAGGHFMLPIWWFSVYYIFHSALVLFGTILVLSKYDIPMCCFSVTDLLTNLHAAKGVLGRLGTGTRLAIRCQKVLTWLAHTAEVLINDSSSMGGWQSMSDSTNPIGYPHKNLGISETREQNLPSFIDIDSALSDSLLDDDIRLFLDRMR